MTAERAEGDRAELMARARRGDRAALGALIEPELDRVYATCRRMVHHPEDAAELAQDALVRAIRGIESFDGRSAFSTWLTRVTINTCLSWHRARNRRAQGTPVAIENADVFPDARGDRGNREPSGTGGVQSEESRVVRALERISPEHRAVLVLRDVRGLDYDAIGAALDLPGGTVRSRLFRARAAMRTAMEAMEASADGAGVGGDGSDGDGPGTDGSGMGGSDG